MASLKGISSTSDFIHIFSWFNKCIYPQVRDRQPQRKKKFDVNRNLLSLRVICYKFKKPVCSLILYNFFVILCMYIDPGQGMTTPWGRTFDVNRNILSLRSFVASLKKKSLWSLIFMILYMYIAPGQGQTAPRGQSFDVNRKVLSLYQFVASLKENLLEVWFYTVFFHDLIHVYSPGAGGIQPLGDKVLMSTETSCHFGHLLLVSNHSWQ